MTSKLIQAPALLADLELGASWESVSPVGSSLDPFIFYERIALYRHLIEATNQTGRFGEDNAGNPLWGLIFQLQWQFSSNRLGLDVASDAIDPNSPWGYGNFTLSVIPYLGAIKAGLVPDVEILPPQGPTQFEFAFGPNDSERTIPANLDPAVAAWKDFFVEATDQSGASSLDHLSKTMWHAHKRSLDVVADRLNALEQTEYSALEIRFLQGWCRMVDFLWASAWKTNFISTTENGLDVLPNRPLMESDQTDDYCEFNDEAADNVRSVLKLQAMPVSKYDFNLKLWRRAMRTEKARGEVEDLLAAAVKDDAPLKARLRLLWLIIRPS